MKDKDKELLKSGLEKPSMKFTDAIMNELNSEEKALSSILSTHGKMETSDAFTSELMTQLQKESIKKPYTPVISKAAWIGIAAMFIGVLILVFANTSWESTLLNDETVMADAVDSTRDFFSGSPLPMYVVAGILLLSLSLLFEQYQPKKRKH